MLAQDEASFLRTALDRWDRYQPRGSVRMWHSIVECSRVNHHICSMEGESEAIQAPGSRAVQVLTGHMIVRTVTGTFEAHAVIAERDRTTQVHTALIQCNPVRAITIFQNCLRGQLVLKRRYLQGELGILIQMHDIGFRRLTIEHACLINFEIP